MKSIVKKLSLLVISILTVTSLNAANLVVSGNKNATKIDNAKIAKPKELRGVWVASVSNIDLVKKVLV
ncbi:hypothetical protein AB8B22_02625 [Leptotrichia sp. HSP-334]|uniref:Uncharacterized protein n=1 Tax=Leptotrichia rugosa TaxID=3239302 RepID=A0AB39VHV4_9FUSO